MGSFYCYGLFVLVNSIIVLVFAATAVMPESFSLSVSKWASRGSLGCYEQRPSSNFNPGLATTTEACFEVTGSVVSPFHNELDDPGTACPTWAASKLQF